MNYEMHRAFTQLVTGMLTGFASLIPTGLVGIAAYVLTALALYTIAQRRGIQKPWLAWIPIADSWLMGSLSDQYRYVVCAEKRAKRKVLLILDIVKALLKMVLMTLVVFICTQAFIGIVEEWPAEMIGRSVAGSAITAAVLLLPLLGVKIAHMVLYYMALYDVYKSLDPANSVVYLVLSIFFGITKPFFLFFNRNKDTGMPPRRDAPQQPPQSIAEPVEPAVEDEQM